MINPEDYFTWSDEEDYKTKEKQMDKTANVSLSVIATGLIALGVTTIGHELLAGAVEIILGIVVYTVYEYFPTKSE